MDNSGIYQIRNIVNNKKYIGSSTDFKRRKRQHFTTLKNDKHFNKHLQRSFNKYGEDKFVFEIIKIIKNENNLSGREFQKVIKLFEEEILKEKNETFYNNSLNSGGGYINKETYIKLSEERKNKKRDPEIGKKISKTKKEYYKNNNGFFKGKKHSEESKEKMSLAKKGKISLFKGKKHSEESKEKNRQAHLGKVSPFKGKTHNKKTKNLLSKKALGRKHSEETRKKMSNSKKGKKPNNYIKLDIDLLIEDRKNGMKVNDILKKHNISKSVYYNRINKFG